MKRYIRSAIGNILNESVETLREIASDPDTDVAILRQLTDYSIHNDDLTLWYVANNPNTPKQISEDILHRLLPIFDKRSSWNKQIMVEKSTDPKFLELFSHSKDWCTRGTVAKNLNTPIDTLRKLAKDRSYQVRAVVADHPNISFETLMALSKDKESMVRIAVAQNPNTPTDILTLMAQDATNLQKNPAIYLALSKNPNISLDALTSMYDILYGTEDYIAQKINNEIQKRQKSH